MKTVKEILLTNLSFRIAEIDESLMPLIEKSCEEYANQFKADVDQRQLYCIEVTRDSEEPFVFHAKFDHEPTRQEILKEIDDQELNYDDNYGKFEYYKVH